ncbi:hypothetical protein [Mycoplasma sp. 4404]|uniref:hypothetical protein n=1 Tax=Mycoplasma sp. 4404 TaxID=3108530 RepID=UPI002B1CE378|nr:hypothetical protein [Mycoplasma sp. 4404]MEA4162509.1 hypothetical protein [Mycoplasma sp. 4404]
MKKFKRKLFCAIAPLSVIPTALLASCAKKTKDPWTNKTNSTNLTELQNSSSKIKLLNPEVTPGADFRDFYADLKDSADNSYPTVVLSRNASQVFLSSFMQIVGHLNAANNEKQPYNDVVYLIDQVVWDIGKTNENPESQRFNFKYLLNKFTPVLNTETGEMNAKDGKLLVLDNLKYTTNNQEDKAYSTIPTTLEELTTYLQPYLEAGIDKFDFYIPDVSLIALSDEDRVVVRDWIFKHANKIVILSDGNSQPYDFIENYYLNFALKTGKSYTQAELLKHWNDLQADEYIKMPIDCRYFFTLQEKVKIYNLENTYINAFNQRLENAGKAWAKLNIKSYPINPFMYKDYMQFAENIDYQGDFERLNQIYGKSFLDLIVEGKNNYSANKKNLIFMGSSLFKKNERGWRLNQNENAYNEVKAYFAKIKELYPADQYNYFFKLHPSYSAQDAVEYIKLLVGEEEYANTITLNPTIAWENMLAIDYHNIEKGTSVLFDQNNNSRTQLYGLQGTTTVLLTTMTFLKQTFSWDLEKMKSFVNIQNFPLANTFNILSRDTYYIDHKKGYQANIAKMEQVYKYFVDTGAFYPKNEWIDMDTFITKINVN